MIRLGGKVFLNDAVGGADIGVSHGDAAADVYELAHRHTEKAFRAAYCPKVSIDDGQRLRDIRDAFAEENVIIAEVGAWRNMYHPDKETARRERDLVVEALAVAEEVGARCAITVVGSYAGADFKEWDPRNVSDEAFDEAVELARSVIDEVAPKRASLVYEIFPFSVVDAPETIRNLIDAIDRDRFGAHMDLVNLINSPRAYFDTAGILSRSLELWGDRIVSAHAKDLEMRNPSVSVILEEVPPGDGGIDYAAYLRGLHQLPHDVPLMLEHLTGESEYDRAADYIRQLAQRESIPL